MSIEKNVEVVKNFLAALGRRDKQGLLALSAEDIEWIIPGEDWPLAGTHRGHAGLENLLQKANETVETSYPEPPEFIAQGDRVLVVGFATGRPAIGAAEQGVGVVVPDEHGADKRGSRSHLPLGVFDAHALAAGEVVVILPERLVAGIRVRIDQLEVLSRPDAQTVGLDAHFHHIGTTNQDRLGEALVDDRLHRPQHPLLLAFAENDAGGLLLNRRPTFSVMAWLTVWS